jgi:hypothetical protein
MPNEQTSAAAVERAFEASIRAPYQEKLEPCPHSFSRTPTGAYVSPHLRDRLADFSAGYRAALAKPATPIEGDAELVERLRREEPTGYFTHGGGSISCGDAERATAYGGKPIYRLRNPDGPEAADRIEALATLQRKGVS